MDEEQNVGVYKEILAILENLTDKFVHMVIQSVLSLPSFLLSFCHYQVLLSNIDNLVIKM